MKKGLLWSGTAITALLLSGCGGGGGGSDAAPSVTEQIKQRDAIVIAYHYPADVCVSDRLKEELRLSSGARNIIVSVESSSVNCSTYGRSNDGVWCMEINVATDSSDTCVVGADAPENSAIKPETMIISTPDNMLRAL